MKRGGFKSIRTRLTFWFLLVSIIPLAVAITVVYFQRIKAIKESQFIKLSTIRDLKVEEIKHWFEERKGDLNTLGSDHEITDVCGVFDIKEYSDKQKQNIHNVNNLLTRYHENYATYSELFIINAKTGIVEMSTEKGKIGRNVSNDPYFTGAIRTRELFIKDIYHSKTTRTNSMTFSLPIFSAGGSGDDIIGILVARVNLEHSLYKLLLDRTGMGRTGETLIINRDVFALNKLRWDDNAPLKLQIRSGPAILAAKGETGVVEAKDYRNVQVLAAYTHIPLMNWGFVAKQDLVEIYAPIRAMVVQLTVLAAIVTFIVLFIAIVIARTIASPIVEMSTVAGKIAEGKLTARNTIKQADELGFLAESFNSLADGLMNRISMQDKRARFTRAMIVKKTLDTFHAGILEKFIDLTQADFGVFFTVNSGDSKLTPCAASGIDLEQIRKQEIGIHDTIFDSAVKKAEVTVLNEIPPDTLFTVKTIAGTAVPKEIIAVPLFIREKAVALLSFGSLSGFTKEDLSLIEQILPVLSTSLASLTSSEATRSLAEELELKNRDLLFKTDELQSQSNELRQQTEELDAQKVQVEEANRMKSVFLANMSHELRTPLNSILSIPQGMLASKDSNLSEKEREYLGVIERNGKVLLNLINDILDLSKVEAGKLEAVNEKYGLNELVTDCVVAVRPLAEKKRLQIKYSVEEDVLPMYGDVGKLRQVFTNIAGNAIKFTHKGSINVNAGIRDSSVYIEITDTGIGIKKSELGFIFDEFRQLDDTNKRKYEGTGLGLAISRKIMRLLGGDILVRSKYRKGSTFTIIFPQRMRSENREEELILRERETRPVSKRQPEKIIPPLSHGTILIVEDNPDAREQIENIITDLALTARIAENGRKAIDVVAGEQIDGIILDLMMPEMDGFELLDRLRSKPETRHVPVLVLTAKELTADDFRKLRENNVTQLVIKGTTDRSELKFKIISAFNIISEGGGSKEADKEKSIPLKKPNQPRRRPLPGVRPKVLIIEDNPDNIQSLKILMEGIDCDFIEAGNGNDGFLAVKNESPDLVLCDIHLPGMNGYDVVTKIRHTKKVSDIPVVAVTAYAMKGDRERILNAGFDEYIAKPVDKEILLEKISDYLQPEEGGHDA